MRKSLLALFTCAILVFSGVQAAEAPGQWYVAPMVSGFWGDSSRFTDDGVGGHLALGHAGLADAYILQGHYGYERPDRVAGLARELSALRTLFDFLMREQVVNHNPARTVRAPKTARRLPGSLDADTLSANLLDR